MVKKAAITLILTSLTLTACAGEDEQVETPMMTVGIEASTGQSSPLLDQGESTSYIFSDPGEYEIFCEPHPQMQMTVIVEDGAELSGEVATIMDNMQFIDQELTVAPGTIITWTNEEEIQHNVAFQ